MMRSVTALRSFSTQMLFLTLQFCFVYHATIPCNLQESEPQMWTGRIAGTENLLRLLLNITLLPPNPRHRNFKAIFPISDYRLSKVRVLNYPQQKATQKGHLSFSLTDKWKEGNTPAVMVEKPKLLLFSSAAAGILRTVLQLKFDAAAVRHSGLTSATMSVTCASTFHYMLRNFPA